MVVDETIDAGAKPIAGSTAGCSPAVASSPSPTVLSDSPIAPANRWPNHPLVTTDHVSRKRSRSLTPPEHRPSPGDSFPNPIIRPAIATPRPPAKRTRLEPPESQSMRPISTRKHFGLTLQRKNHDRSAPISQEVLLAQVMQSQSKGGIGPSEGVFFPTPAVIAIDLSHCM
jgi:hypothetical protein